MKIRFYYIDYSQGRGELAGVLEVEGKKISLATHDKKLKDFLSTPYTTVGGSGGKVDVVSDYVVTYMPYTKEFLDAVETECWSRGFIAEREE